MGERHRRGAPRRQGGRRLGPLVLLASSVLPLLAAAFLPTGTAQAQDAEGLLLRSLDARTPGVVAGTLLATDQPLVIEQIQVIQNDTATPYEAFTLEEANQAVATVLLLDTSEAMAEGNAVGAVKEAAAQYVLNKLPQERIAVVAVSGAPRVVVEFSTNVDVLLAGIDNLQAQGQAQLNDGARLALTRLETTPVDEQRNLVMVTGATEAGSTASLSQVQGLAVSSAAVVFAANVPVTGGSAALGQALTEATGGPFLAADVPQAAVAAVGEFQNMVRGQLNLSWPAPGGDVVAIDVQVIAGTRSAEGTVNVGAFAAGSSLTPPSVERPVPVGPAFLQGTLGMWLGVLLALAAATLFALGLGLLFVRDRTDLASVLQPYAQGPFDPGAGEGEDDEDKAGGLVETKLVQRAVDLTEQLAEKRGLVTQTAALLERADMPLRPAEALFFYLAIVVVLGALITVLSGSLLIGLIAFIVIAMLPPAVVSAQGSRRQKAFNSQLPDMLQLLSSSLRAGYSLPQGIETVAQETEGPMGRELKRIVVETRLGRPMEEAMRSSAERMHSPDFEWAVMAIRIQREVGGNLAELLMTVAETMVQRERLRRDVKSLTAEGRVSAYVLGVLPIALGLVMYVVNPDYISVLFKDPRGQFMLGFAVLLAIGGFFWMNKTIQVDV